MPRIVVEWDAGQEVFELEKEEYEEYLESGESPEMYFDAHVSDVWVETFTRVVD